MNDVLVNELELAPASVVKQAARDFAATLAETPQFKAYEAAADRLNQDAEAQQAIEAFETKAAITASHADAQCRQCCRQS